MAVLSTVWNIRKDTIEVELTTGPGGLKGRELHMLSLKAHFEGVLSVNFGEVVGDLDGGTDFIRGKEGVAAKCLQAVETKGRQTTVGAHLRNAENAELSRRSEEHTSELQSP